MIDLNDIQGLTIQPYRYRRARYLLFHCPEGSDAKGFIRALSESLNYGNPPDGDGPAHLTNLALTATGLALVGLSASDVAQFDLSFRAGPNPALTGDVVTSASGPSHWWEQQFGPRQIDILVIVHARKPAPLADRTDQILETAQKLGVVELLPRADGMRLDGQALTSGRLHFGYKDGISQPDLDWADPTGVKQVDYRNFILGYSNDNVFSSPASGPMADLARNSSYLIMRWLYQDVARFQLFLHDEGARLASKLTKSQEQAEELLAAKMLGRWRDGTPLVLSPDGPSTAIRNDSDFDYGSDLNGMRCPFSSHVRVVNPRSEKLTPVAQIEGVPRVIRRGMPYGPEMQEGRVDDDGIDRGLIGVFLCTNIVRQFYKLTQWISHNDFSPVFANPRTQDALFANRAIPGAAQEFRFLLPDESQHLIPGLPDFIRTKGTEFFLLPSRTMIQKLIH